MHHLVTLQCELDAIGALHNDECEPKNSPVVLTDDLFVVQNVQAIFPEHSTYNVHIHVHVIKAMCASEQQYSTDSCASTCIGSQVCSVCVTCTCICTFAIDFHMKNQ